MDQNTKGKSPPSTGVAGVKSNPPHPGSKWRQIGVLVAVLLLAVVIWLIPPPSGVQPRAWHLLAIFVATIVGIITKPLPMGAIALFGIAATALTRTLSINQALSGFGNSTIWLIVVAFFISRGFIKTGLGSRIAYLFMAALGKKTLGLSYGLIATDLVLAPAIPSNTARAGGIVFPLVLASAKAFGSEPNDGTGRKIGAFLMQAAFQGNVITSAMFLTAMAANPLAAKLAAQMHIDVSWGEWALAAIVPGLTSLVLIPLILYKVYPPEVKETPEASQLAKQKVAEMGKMHREEWVMLGVFFLLLLLWILGDQLAGIDSATTALFGLSVLLITGVLTWKDILRKSLVRRAGDDGQLPKRTWSDPLVYQERARNGRRHKLDPVFSGVVPRLFFQSLPLCQSNRPCQFDVRRVSLRVRCGRYTASAGGSGARIPQ
jgi:DASS family divalent anion:Na+ symporter